MPACDSHRRSEVSWTSKTTFKDIQQNSNVCHTHASKWIIIIIIHFSEILLSNQLAEKPPKTAVLNKTRPKQTNKQKTPKKTKQKKHGC